MAKIEKHSSIVVNDTSANCVEFDVVIIGGGLTGLVSAYTILKKDNSLRVVVLDEKNDLIKDDHNRDDDDDNVDLKYIGKWVLHDHKYVMSLCRELAVPIVPVQNVQNSMDFGCGFISKLVRFEVERFVKEIDFISLNHLR